MLLFGTAMITWQRGTENLIINQHVLRSRTLMKNWSGWKKYQILIRLCNEKVVLRNKWIIYHTVLRILAALVRCTSFLRSSREYSPFQEAQQFLIVGFLRKKMSYFLDHHLHHVTKGGKSYVKDTKSLWKKLNNLENWHLILYESQWMWLVFILVLRMMRVWKLCMKNWKKEKLKNYYFEFDSCIKEQVTGTVIGTKFTPTYPS